MFNPDSKTFRFIKNKMMLRENQSWNPDGDNGVVMPYGVHQFLI